MSASLQFSLRYTVIIEKPNNMVLFLLSILEGDYSYETI